MKLLTKEVEKRLSVNLNKSITANGVAGVMNFGTLNDYPQLLERLIQGSSSGVSVSNTYAKFLTGEGFAENVNNTIIGVDERGKEVNILSLLRKVSLSIAYYNGAYIHVNKSLDNKIVNSRIVPFKHCRFSKEDDLGYCAKIGVYNNWEKDKENKNAFDTKKISWFNIYNTNDKVFVEQVNQAGGIEKYKGQINFLFLDNQFLYPVSPFDSVYLDLDTENQIQLYKNRQLRNGFFNKVVFRVAGSSNTTEQKELSDGIKEFMGADGKSVLVVEDEVDENGNVKEKGSFIIDNIPSNVNDKIFENWEKSISNNIRKCIKALPAILIDYEESKLGTTSGDAIQQATNYYNALTRDDRAAISNFFKETFSTYKGLENVDWTINELNLIEKTLDVKDVNKEAQAILKGSVGGVTALIALQESVSNGKTDINSAIEIVKEIYGIEYDKAKLIIGTPKTIIDGTTDMGNTVHNKKVD